MNPLLEIKQRLVYSAVAGTQLLAEDFRLKRLMEAFAPLASKNPVFQKIYTGLEQLLSAEDSKRNGLLLDLMGLLDAVIYTQGATQVEGEKIQLQMVNSDAKAVPMHYSELSPLLEALTTTGSGRMEVLENVVKEKSHMLADYRVIHALINDLDDAYGGMAYLVYRVLEHMITQEPIDFFVGYDYYNNDYYGDVAADRWRAHYNTYTLPKLDTEMMLYFLKKDFGNQELMQEKHKVFAQKIKLVQAIVGTKENDWYLSLLEYAEKDVRENAIKALSCEKKNLPLLWDMVKTEKGNCKKSVFCTLAKHIDADSKEFWQKELKKRPVSAMYLINNVDDISSDLVAELLQNILQNILDDVETKLQYEHLKTVLYATVGKSSDGMLETWKWIFENMQALQKKKTNKNENFCVDIMDVYKKAVLWDCNEKMVVFTKENLQDKSWAYDLLFLLDLLTEKAEKVYDKWIVENKEFMQQWLNFVGYQEVLTEKPYYYVTMGYTTIFDENEYILLKQRPSNQKLKEPLDIRWFSYLKKTYQDKHLYRLLPVENVELLQYYGAYFYDRALTYKKEFPVLDRIFYFDALQKCKWKKWSGVIAHMCKVQKTLYLHNIVQAFEIYEKEADDVKEEGKRVMAVYKNKRWVRNGMTTVEDLERRLIDNGWLDEK